MLPVQEVCSMSCDKRVDEEIFETQNYPPVMSLGKWQYILISIVEIMCICPGTTTQRKLSLQKWVLGGFDLAVESAKTQTRGPGQSGDCLIIWVGTK